MLTELYIENFALIDRLTVAFAPGLNILTGETGAGNRLSSTPSTCCLVSARGPSLVRTGTPRAVVQAVFELADVPQLLPALAELGIEPDDGTAHALP